MIEISLTRFLDFTLKSGSPQLTSLRQTKQQVAEGYDPMTDYYKQTRDAIDRPNASLSGRSLTVHLFVQRAFHGSL